MKLVLTKFQHYLDVITVTLESAPPIAQGFLASNKTGQPTAVCFPERFLSRSPMAQIGVHTAENHAVFQHHRAINPANIEIDILTV